MVRCGGAAFEGVKARHRLGLMTLLLFSWWRHCPWSLAVRLCKEMGEEVSFLVPFRYLPPDEQDWSGSVDTEAQEEVDVKKHNS